MAVMAALQAHLDSGTTTLCRCWRLSRRDGVLMGFTDHDRDLTFDGLVFRADTGLSAQALQQTTGLSVDNTEALGALSSSAVTEADLTAGRFDGAAVESWLVNWENVAERHLTFQGAVGEVSTSGGEFRAELRGLAETLNHVQGRSFQPLCSARLGDGACKVHLGASAYTVIAAITAISSPQEFTVSGLGSYGDTWFERGYADVISGAAAGLQSGIKSDVRSGSDGLIALWEDLRAPLAIGDQLRLRAGCDKRADSCRTKFNNFVNFRGFPHIPGEDWMMAVPKQGGQNAGGSLNP